MSKFLKNSSKFKITFSLDKINNKIFIYYLNEKIGKINNGDFFIKNNINFNNFENNKEIINSFKKIFSNSKNNFNNKLINNFNNNNSSITNSFSGLKSDSYKLENLLKSSITNKSKNKHNKNNKSKCSLDDFKISVFHCKNDSELIEKNSEDFNIKNNKIEDENFNKNKNYSDENVNINNFIYEDDYFFVNNNFNNKLIHSCFNCILC